jgi:hypothetical protein
VDRKETNGEITRGVYSEQLTVVIGKGAYDEEGHMNTKFLEANGIGPYPRELQRAWDVMRDEAGGNYDFRKDFWKKKQEKGWARSRNPRQR